MLSRMARDILAVPVSTVASELAFSITGRVFNPFRSSLLSEIVKAFVCALNWLRALSTPICVSNSLNNVIEYELFVIGTLLIVNLIQTSCIKFILHLYVMLVIYLFVIRP